jgi:hypothetical protein
VLDEQLVLEYKNAGYDGIVLTNHINWTYNNYQGKTYKEKTDYYFSAVDRIKELGKKQGISVLFGAEVVAVTDDGMHQEFLLYGFDRQFLYDNSLVNNYDQKGLFELAKKHNLFMSQTHPFRCGEKLGNPLYMHGAEAFNAHYHHDNFNEKAMEFCKQNNLKMLSGTDYHHAGQPILGGAYLPDDITTERALADYLLSCQPDIMVQQEKCLQARKEYLERKLSK